MLNFIPWVLLVLQKRESSDLGIGGTLPGLCHYIWQILMLRGVGLNNFRLKIKAYM